MSKSLCWWSLLAGLGKADRGIILDYRIPVTGDHLRFDNDPDGSVAMGRKIYSPSNARFEDAARVRVHCRGGKSRGKLITLP
jgi:hypothetical protein